MQATYENHFALKQNKLCPFKFLNERKTVDSICNWHKNIEIIIVTDGEGTAQYDGERIPIREGDIVAVNSGALHCFSSEQGFDFIGIIIDDDFCRENGIETEKISLHHTFRDKKTEKLLFRVTHLLGDYIKSKSNLVAAKTRCAVLVLIIDMMENHSLPKTSGMLAKNPSEDYVKKVIGYLNEHFAETVRLEELASLCGITKFHLAREFKCFTAETVFTYLTALKCRNAKTCLSSGMSVTETALACGFESVSYFSRTYKKVMGCSPSGVKNA